MSVPPHLEPLRRSVLMDECLHCDDVTDLQATTMSGDVIWSCWLCQGLPELHLHRKCEGCGAWFVGTESAKRCGHAHCKEQG